MLNSTGLTAARWAVVFLGTSIGGFILLSIARSDQPLGVLQYASLAGFALAVAGLVYVVTPRTSTYQYGDDVVCAPAEYDAAGVAAAGPKEHADLYLDLMKRAVTNLLYQDPPLMIYADGQARLGKRFELEHRVSGRDAPIHAHTMIGWNRLNSLQTCITTALRESVPGDLLEAGSYRGGAAIFMRAVLKAHGVTDRKVFACDVFQAFRPKLPPWPVMAALQMLAAVPSRSWRRRYFKFLESMNSSPTFPQVTHVTDDWVDLTMWNMRHPTVVENTPANNLEIVRSRFARYGLLDDQTVFLQGFFRDTLPQAPVQQLCILRLDGDTYESTMESLELTYSKLAQGGFCIVDDYGTFACCRMAVDEFRRLHNIQDPIHPIDGYGVYWRKSRAG